MVTPDGVLWHNGMSGGFHTLFGVSTDRITSIAVTCNGVAIEPFDIVEPLLEIWDTN